MSIMPGFQHYVSVVPFIRIRFGNRLRYRVRTAVPYRRCVSIPCIERIRKNRTRSYL